MAEFHDTIVAIATPAGIGGLGVIRLSGPNALQIADALIDSSAHSPLQKVATHTLHHRFIKKAERLIDEVVFSIFRAPKSYTGEDVVEISCHGSPVVLKELVKLCQNAGARLARPGEFTQRAYVNGKLDLAQAEAVADLIHAQSSKAQQQATNQLRGVSERIRDLRQRLLKVLAELEANLDFVEEDIPPLERHHLKEELVTFQNHIQQLLGTSVRARIFRQGIRVALLGRPNVGKSSLFNALLAFDRAIVSDQPGTTRDTIEERLEWDGIPVVLVDTAGVRKTHDPIEEKGLGRTRQAQQLADLIFFLVDGSTLLTAEDATLADSLDAKKTLVVLNKQDVAQKLSAQDFKKWGFARVVSVSALESKGLDVLQNQALENIFSTDKQSADQHETPLVMSERHLQHLEKAAAHIHKAQSSLEQNRTEESVSVDVRQALEELGAITGESVSEDLLSQIFSTFCIGK